MKTTFAILILATRLATAAAQNFAIDWQTIDGGGGTSTGGTFRLRATIGQPDAGGPLTNGQFAVTGGFWALPVAVQTVGAPTLTITRLNATQARISWEPNTPGYVLQETATLTPPNWVNSSSGTANPTTVPSGPAAKYYRLGPAPVVVLAIETSSANTFIPEGGSAQVGIRLTAQPPANTTVTISSADISKATVAPTTLNFTTANWNTFQNVTINGVADGNTADEATTLQVSSPGLADRTVNVYVVDVAQNLIVSPFNLVVGEAGSMNFNVRLASQPAANVAVFLTSSNPAKATVSPAAMTFTPANWNVSQIATVSGVNDLDSQNEALVVTVLCGLAVPVQVSVSVIDDGP